VFVCPPVPVDLAAGCGDVVGLSVLIARVISVASMPKAVAVADALCDVESVDSCSAVTDCALVNPVRRTANDVERSAGLVERTAVEVLGVERGVDGVVDVVGVGDGDVLVAAVVVPVVTVADVVSVANAAAAVEPAAGDTLKIDNAKARIPAIPAVIPASTPIRARAPTPLGATRRL
jgi:hypothetical protein